MPERCGSLHDHKDGEVRGCVLDRGHSGQHISADRVRWERGNSYAVANAFSKAVEAKLSGLTKEERMARREGIISELRVVRLGLGARTLNMNPSESEAREMVSQEPWAVSDVRFTE